MHIKRKLLIALSSVLLSMCTFYDQGGAVVSSNGLSCQNRTDFVFFKRQQSAYCYYRCPDQTIRRPEIPEKFSTSSPLYSASKEDLDARFCSLAPQPTAMQPSATASPIAPVSPSATREISATESPTAPVSPSPTAASVASPPPLLQGDVTMCDVAADLINFRMAEPVPDLTGKALDVQIAGQQSSCDINPVNTSLLTCTIPPSVTFPARIVVRLDGAVVNDFTYSGLGCAKLTTPFPTTTP